MAKPSDFPDWALNSFNDPLTGQPNKIKPPTQKINDGWSPGEIPPGNWDNWIKNNIGQWVRYFDSLSHSNVVNKQVYLLGTNNVSTTSGNLPTTWAGGHVLFSSTSINYTPLVENSKLLITLSGSNFGFGFNGTGTIQRFYGQLSMFINPVNPTDTPLPIDIRTYYWLGTQNLDTFENTVNRTAFYNHGTSLDPIAIKFRIGQESLPANTITMGLYEAFLIVEEIIL